MALLAETSSRFSTVTSSLILLSALALLYSLCTVVYNLFLHPLRKYPGPKLWAISRLPFSYTWLSGSAHKKIFELHRQYGDVVRIAPNELIFGYPESFNDIMGHRKRGQDENGKDPDFWHGNDLTLVGSNRERHARIRKVLSHGFSAQAMTGQEPIFRRYVSLLIDRLKTASESNQAQEMTAWYNWVTFDMIGDLAFGEPFGCLQETRYHPWVKLIFQNIQGIAMATALSKFPLANALAKLMTPKKVLQDVQTHHDFTEAQVAKRLSFKDPRPDFMEPMIAAREKSQISHPEVLANAHNLIVGGSETTATVLAGVTYLLCTNKPILEKLHQELKDSFEREEEINLLNVQKLQYMTAVLHEGLRLYPPVPSAIPRITPPGGTTIRGEHIPHNTILGIWPWPMFHNPDFFKDAESFIPERWLGDPRFNGDQKAAFEPFSVGPRNCIGKK
ncbi:hypothetical protein ACJ41O_005618 [Fusarium nematophilum]